MPRFDCPEADCPFQTPDAGDAVGAVHLKHHLDTQHPAGGGGGGGGRQTNIKIERPVLEGKINGDDWLNFNRDWENFKGLNNIAANAVNRHFVLCSANFTACTPRTQSTI